VLVVLRYDGDIKFGGDVVLLKELANAMHGFEYEVIVGVPASVRDYQLVICANLDRPVEAGFLLAKCKEAGVPLHLMSLHHPARGVVDFLKHGLFGWKRLIAMLSKYDPVQYEQLLWNLRVVSSMVRAVGAPKFANVRATQKVLLRDSEAILVVSAAEAAAIELDIGPIETRVIEVPHVLASHQHPKHLMIKRDIVFCPGRIEARKNQLFMLSVAESLPEIEFHFMGATSASELGYGRRFRERASKLSNVTLLQSTSSEDFSAYLLSAEVVLTASWFEVTSLIELEVLSKQKKLVTSAISYNDSFFQNPFVYAMNDLNDCKQMILTAFSLQEAGVVGEYPTQEKIIGNYLDGAVRSL
jgi:glycosyltransferase involved in cell wall biosynthesis